MTNHKLSVIRHLRNHYNPYNTWLHFPLAVYCYFIPLILNLFELLVMGAFSIFTRHTNRFILPKIDVPSTAEKI